MQPSDIDIQALVRRVRARALTRFAPAPTGWLHLGHVLNARYVWGIAEAIGGRVLLRIEDHDRERCRPEFETGILDDLDWLGFAPDVFATRDFRAGGATAARAIANATITRPFRSSARGVWSMAAIARARTPGRHRGTAAPRSSSTPERAATGVFLSAMRSAGACVSTRTANEPELFDDAMLGPQSQDPLTQCGDLLIRDRRGNWTYQFAVTVDDWRQQIDLVIRGRDLLASTGRQIRLAQDARQGTPGASSCIIR